MLFGFELEFFVVNKHGEVVVPRPELRSLTDGGGILVEARSKPLDHPKLAETSLKMAITELRKTVRKSKRKLLLADEADVSPRSLAYARKHKKFISYDERPAFERYRNPVMLTHSTPEHYKAGLHIHLSQPDSYDAKKFVPFDILYPIRLLDQEFAEVIRMAGRHPGAYRMKPYGVEYRSLPATVPLRDVTKALVKLLSPREFEMYEDNQIPDDDEDEL